MQAVNSGFQRSGKAVAVLKKIHSIRPPEIPGMGGRFPRKDGETEEGRGMLGASVAKRLRVVRADGDYLHSLKALTPFAFTDSSTDLEVNSGLAGTVVPSDGCIEIAPYYAIREAAKEVINPSRFGDGEQADKLFIPNRDRVADPYLETMLTALYTAGAALREYSDVLLERGSELEARAFLGKCDRMLFPLLDSGRRWETGLAMVNSLADALEGGGGLTRAMVLDAVTAEVRRRMHGADPLLARREKYTNLVDEMMLREQGNVTYLQ